MCVCAPLWPILPPMMLMEVMAVCVCVSDYGSYVRSVCVCAITGHFQWHWQCCQSNQSNLFGGAKDDNVKLSGGDDLFPLLIRSAEHVVLSVMGQFVIWTHIRQYTWHVLLVPCPYAHYDCARTRHYAIVSMEMWVVAVAAISGCPCRQYQDISINHKLIE